MRTNKIWSYTLTIAVLMPSFIATSWASNYQCPPELSSFNLAEFQQHMVASADYRKDLSREEISDIAKELEILIENRDKETVSEFDFKYKEWKYHFKRSTYFVKSPDCACIDSLVKRYFAEKAEKDNLDKKADKKAFRSATENKYTHIGPEDGWRNLAWGMTLKEVEVMYESEHDKPCSSLSKDRFIEYSAWGGEEYAGDIPSDTSNLKIAVCLTPDGEAYSSGLIFYNNRFIGKIVDMPSEINDYRTVLKKLKVKYPNGKVNTNDKSLNYFAYYSERIRISTRSGELYFLDGKTVSKWISSAKEKQQNEKKNKEQRLKKLF